MRPRRCCGTVSIGGGGCGEARGHGRLEGSARCVGCACRRGRLAGLSRRRCDRSAGRASFSDRRRDSDSGGARDERHTDGVRVGDARFGARLPLPRRRLAPSDRPYRGLRGARLRRCDHGERHGRPSLGRALRRPPAGRRRPGRRVARSERRRNRRHIRLAPRARPPERRPDQARPGQEGLGQGLGLRGRGRPGCSHRLDRRRRHARGPAAAPDLGTRRASRRGPTSSSAGSMPTSRTSRLRPLPTPADPAGAARPARCPTGRRTRRERTTARCTVTAPVRGPPTPRHHRHAPRLPAPVKHPVTPPLRAAHGSGARAALVRAALAQVGWPYVWGGESRTEGGFDCSGLVDHAYARAGYQLPGRPTADVLWAMSVPLAPADLRPAIWCSSARARGSSTTSGCTRAADGLSPRRTTARSSRSSR